MKSHEHELDGIGGKEIDEASDRFIKEHDVLGNTPHPSNGAHDGV